MEKLNFFEHIKHHKATQLGLGLMAVGAAVEIASIPLDNALMMAGGWATAASGALITAREALRSTEQSNQNS